MTSRKQNWPQRGILLVACFAVAAVYAWFSISVYRAQRFADCSNQSCIEKAVALAPRDAIYHDLLCRSMVFVSQQPEKAVAECGKASNLNPYDSSIWLDLAQAYYSAGDSKQADAAIHKAITVDPTTPDTAWNAANFFLVQGNISEAMNQFAMVLREEPSLTPAALNICWQSLHDINRIQSILPPNPVVYLDFIRLLLSTGETTSATQVWSSLMQLKPDFDFHLGLFYIDSLLHSHSVVQASDAWKQLTARSKALQAYYQPGNLIADPSFMQEVLDSGFDWRYASRPQINVTLDKAEFHSSDRSLRLEFSGTGSDVGIFQYVAVHPDMRYRLSAWIKSDRLETANGPMLALIDAYDNGLYAATEETTGTTPWHRIETQVQTGPESKLLILTILRRPSETRIQGRYWIDDIKLEAISPVSEH